MDEILIGFGAALFFSGPGFYIFMYARYRNQAQRHYHEKETTTQMNNLQAQDDFLRRDKGQHSPNLSGGFGGGVGNIIGNTLMGGLGGTIMSGGFGGTGFGGNGFDNPLNGGRRSNKHVIGKSAGRGFGKKF